MQSKRKPMETINLSDMSLDEAALSAKTKVTGYMEKPEREPGQKFEGEPEELAQKVASLLDEEENVI
jgi:electron transfer flavoprotein beta subunit